MQIEDNSPSHLPLNGFAAGTYVGPISGRLIGKLKKKSNYFLAVPTGLNPVFQD